MNKLKTILVIFAASILFSCNEDDFRPCIWGNNDIVTESRSLANFASVDYLIEGDLEVRKSNRYEIVIEGNSNQLDDLETRVSNGTLKIYKDRCLKGTDFKFVLYTPELKALKLSGSGNIISEDEFVSPTMRFEVSGSGSIHAYAGSSGKVDSRISGSGDICLEGSCDVLEAQLSGSGEIAAYLMVCNTMNASISGSGNIESFVTNMLNATISGSGKVFYKGGATVNSSISGSGKVVKVQ